MSPGYVTFEAGATLCAVAIEQVREVVRGAEVQLLPGSGRTVAGRPLVLADARGRTRPVLDLRTDPARPADVLLAQAEDRAGLLVDRVREVLAAGALVAEPVAPAALPAYASGMLRAVAAGEPVLLVCLPEVPAEPV